MSDEAKIYLTVDGDEAKVEVVDGEKRIDISNLILLRGLNMRLDSEEWVIFMDCTVKMYTKGGTE